MITKSELLYSLDPVLELGSAVFVRITIESGDVAGVVDAEGRVLGIASGGTIVEVKLDRGEVVRVRVPDPLPQAPVPVQEVQVREVPFPAGGRGVLLQLPDGFIVMRPKGARDVGNMLLKAAAEAAAQ